MLLAASQINPIYSLQYVAFCLPAVALLAGAGIATLTWPVRITALALAVVLALPMQLAIRGPGSGGSLRASAQILAANERPGDAVIYPAPGAYPGLSIPPDRLAYPSGFGQLRDIGLARSAAAAGYLNGASVALSVLKQRECAARRIWAVEMGPGWQNPAGYLASGLRLTHEWRPGSGAMRLWLYQRNQPCRAGAAGGTPGAWEGHGERAAPGGVFAEDLTAAGGRV